MYGKGIILSPALLYPSKRKISLSAYEGRGNVFSVGKTYGRIANAVLPLIHLVGSFSHEYMRIT